MSQRLLFFTLLTVFSIGYVKGDVVFEAEDYYLSSGDIEDEHTGFSGDGYAEMTNAEGVTIEWTFNAYEDYNDSIGVAYALGKYEQRDMQLFVNNVLVDTLEFDSTGIWTNYDTCFSEVSLSKGENTVKIVALYEEGGPNIDFLWTKFSSDVTYSVAAAAESNGSVSIDPDQTTYNYGDRISITATPATGYTFSGWSGDVSGKSNPLTLVVDTAYDITANFANIPAFPGAEGFGAMVTGGRGGEVIKVTNLNDAGTGSLRAAIQQSGSRTIVFEVSGTIYLSSTLKISNGDVTIAGQTAPGGGITLANYTLTISTDNVIIRYIRSRLGDVYNVEDDAMNGTDHDRILLDHCTMSWSVDETASFYNNTNFTMQYCMITESLYNSAHEKGSHGYGGIWGGQGASFHHNLIAHHTSRNPRFCGSRYTGEPDLEIVDYRNNVIYNWGSNSVYGAEGGSYNIVNNYYKKGPATNSGVRLRIIAPNEDDGSNTQAEGVWGSFYVNGNYMPHSETVTENNWVGVQKISGDEEDAIKSETEFDVDSVTTYDAQIAFEHVLAQVGACYPYRDEIDSRIIQEVISGTATYVDGGTYGDYEGIIDSQSDVGSWPELPSETAPTDTDGDGMPDAWETANGLDVSDASDGNGDADNDGYTNLEEYLNSLVEYTYIIRPLNLQLEEGESGEVILTWEDVTDDEEGFDLERRKDNGSYEVIAQLDDNDTIYTDASLSDIGVYTYRLRSFNDVDTSYYTDTVYFEIEASSIDVYKGDDAISVYPNPFSENFTIALDMDQAQSIQVALISMTGQTLSDREYSMTSGANELSIETSDLLQGIYIVSVTVGDGIYIKKLQKH